MTITLLLDLDDTLLDTNMEAFAPAYFQALAGALSEVVPPERMLPALQGGTRAMMENRDAGRTLKQVFDAVFFPALAVERAALEARIDRFYAEVFPTLQSVTRSRPQAVEFVDWALEAGHRLAIATNPFFPQAAVQHRLRWAGLPPERYRFALISSYEAFHFTKEAGSYFPELLGQLGWPEDPLVMIGNDLQMDLEPARRAGLPVYWLRSGEPDGAAGVPQGGFRELQAWLTAADGKRLQPLLDTPEAILSSLPSTPAAAASLTAGLSREAWRHQPSPSGRCPLEIVCHLRDVELEVWQPRLEKVLGEADPLLAEVDPGEWVDERGVARQDPHQALADFWSARQATLSRLASLGPEWQRPARQAVSGPTTLLEVLAAAVRHDRAQLRQLWKGLQP